MRLRLLLAGAATATAAVVLAGCGSGAHYVANRDEEIYLKLPSGWTAIDASFPEAEGAPLPWRVVLDRDDHALVDHLDLASPPQPVGQVAVLEISAAQREILSPSQLRAFGLGTDPLTVADDASAGVEILGNAYDYEVDGYHGNRIRFSYPVADGSQVVLEQVALTDPGLSRMYLLQLRCEVACFEENTAEIEQIIESLHLGEG